MTDANRNVLPGHDINLQVVCNGISNDQITDVQWTLPGIVFDHFIETESEGRRVDLMPAQLQARTVSFHWADVGDGRKVSVTFKADGKDCKAAETFNVKDPDVQFPANFNPPRIGKNKIVSGPKVELGDAYPGTTEGIVFQATVQKPAGFGFGTAKWYYGQLINSRVVKRDTASATCKCRDTSVLVNDNPWPYLAGASPGMPPWDDGTTVREVVDSPWWNLLSTQDYAWRTDNWNMYIMFLPAADPPGAGASQPVPLRRLPWKSSWCASNGAGGWKLVMQSASVDGNWLVERVHPEWTDYFTNFSFAACPCPPECSSSSSSSASGGSSSSSP